MATNSNNASAAKTMSMEFGMLKFSSADFMPSGIIQALHSTNVAGMIPVKLGCTVQSILVSQLLNLNFTPNEAL